MTSYYDIRPTYESDANPRCIQYIFTGIMIAVLVGARYMASNVDLKRS